MGSTTRTESNKRKQSEVDEDSSNYSFFSPQKRSKPSPSIFQIAVSSASKFLGYLTDYISPSKPQKRPTRRIKNTKKRNSKPRISMSKPDQHNSEILEGAHNYNNNSNSNININTSHIKKQKPQEPERQADSPPLPLSAYNDLDSFPSKSPSTIVIPSSPPTSSRVSVSSPPSFFPPTTYASSSYKPLPKLSQNKYAYPTASYETGGFLEEYEKNEEIAKFENRLKYLIIDDIQKSRAPESHAPPSHSSYAPSHSSYGPSSFYSSISITPTPATPTPSTPVRTPTQYPPHSSVYNNKDKRKSLDPEHVILIDDLDTSTAFIPRTLTKSRQVSTREVLRRQRSEESFKAYMKSPDYEFITKSHEDLKQKKETYMKQVAESLRKYAAEQGGEKGDVPTLTADQNKQVAEILSSRGGDDDIISEAFSVELKREDIRCLKPGEWLNDEVINFYINMLMERNKTSAKIKSYIFNTHFYSLLYYNTKKYDYARVRRWTSKIGEDVFKLDKIIVPIHLGQHWCLAVINLKQKRFEYYDSLLGSNDECINVLRRWLQDEAKKANKQLDLNEWTNYTPKDIPRQKNGYDCGVFMLRFADRTSKDSSFNFSQDGMPNVRKLMVLEIVNKKAH